jgi:hypothetical protein
MVSSNKSLLTQASIGVNKSSFFPCSIDPIDFCLGEIIKSNLIEEGRRTIFVSLKASDKREMRMLGYIA